MMRTSTYASKTATHDGQQGSALLVVLLMLGTIAALAAVVARSVSGAALEMSVSQLSARKEWDVRTGIELGVAAVRQLGPAVRIAEASVSLPDRRIHVRITNERARIDLNAASQTVLSALLKANDASDPEVLAQQAIEWRGGSPTQRSTGSGSELFSSFGSVGGLDLRPDTELRKAPTQGVGTRFFYHPAQLASVPGFSAPLVARLLPLISVANGATQVDPFIAPRSVLMALPGTTAATVDAFIEARERESDPELAIKLLGLAETLVTSKAAVGWRLQITSTGAAGNHRAEAIVAVLEGDGQPYRVLYVSDED
jgi:type II secretory pathway component PulK